MSTEQSLNDVLSALELNLAKERKALLDGAYDAIGAILSEKERLGAILDAILVDPHRAAQLPAYRKRLQKVVDAAKENEKLLAAAKIGAASALRLSDFRPVVGLIRGLSDPFTGEIMGRTAERLSREFDTMSENGLRFDTETAEAIGKAEARHTRSGRVALWIIAAAAVWMALAFHPIW